MPMKSRVLLALVLCLALLGGAEWWLRGNLFKHVSYSNSESIDAQLRARQEGAPWDLMFVGDSEVRWGIDPAAIDAAFQAEGIQVKSFNHAFDGFGASWWPRLLPSLLKEPSLDGVKTVVVGVQLIDLHRVVSQSGEDCGSLQRPVLTSPFATDIGAGALCRTRSWDAQLGRDLFSPLWTVRYSSSVRSLLLPAAFSRTGLQFNSRKLEDPFRGFQAHRTIAQDQSIYAAELRQWKAQFKPERDFKPLPQGAWTKLVAPGGFFDELQRSVEGSGRKLALFALPTNPEVIDTFGRREDYAVNSRLLAQWAAARGVPYVDGGINDRPDAGEFFSDMRHLSGTGARIYSRQLGQALARAGAVPAAARR
jgi:hypothetical protein